MGFFWGIIGVIVFIVIGFLLAYAGIDLMFPLG